MSLHIVILAAGVGKRMHSNTPKILHKLGSITMLQHIINIASNLDPVKLHVVVGQDYPKIKQAISNSNINWVQQKKPLGTGHAVSRALPDIPKDAYVLILCADTPLLRTSTIEPLIIKTVNSASLGLLVANVQNPFGLGRVLRSENDNIVAIIEEKDASLKIKEIKEIYTGICCIKSSDLHALLPMLNNNNAQNEYYLTDIIAIAVKENLNITSITVTDNDDILGVNNRMQLQIAERIYQSRLAEELMLSGVTMADAKRIDIRGTLTCEQDVFIDVNNVFSGIVSIGNNTNIEANCSLTNVKIGANCSILANSVLEDCIIADNCQIGPFARIRPGTILENDCKIGNFVEVKNSKINQGTKANHLSYLGDSVIGKEVNIGAGTITCNYDGANKYQTIIEDAAFIGSGTQLIAPISIGKNATIGAGSTIRENAPANELTLTISSQKSIKGWQRPKKNNKE